MDVSKMTKAELIALLSAGTKPAAAPQVASLATIPDTAWAALRAAVVNGMDNEGRDATFLSTVRAFGEAVPTELKGQPIPLTVAEAQATLVANEFAAKQGDLSALTEEQRKAKARSLTQKRSRAVSLFQCAAIIPAAYAQGFTGGIVKVGTLCTALKANEYDLSKALASLADKPKDHGAYIAQTMSGILNSKGDLNAQCAKAKAELVYWCDKWGIKPRHADEYRNLPLALQ